MDTKVLSKIINSNSEFRPTIDDNKWVTVDKYKVMRRKLLKYTITDELLTLMNDYTKKYKQIESANINDSHIIKKYNDSIALIYIINNVKTNKSYVGYTTSPLFTFIKLNIHHHNMGQNSVFDNFVYKKLTDFNVELLEYIHYNRRADINKRKKYWIDKIFNDNNDSNAECSENTSSEDNKSETQLETDPKFDTKFYNKRISIFFDVFTEFITKFNKVIGYIYKLENKKNGLIFIGGDTKKPNLDDILELLTTLDNNEKIKKDIKHKKAFKLEILEKYYAKSEMDMMFKIDYYKTVYNSIENGYNMGYCMDESEQLFAERLGTKAKDRLKRSIFLKINRHLFDKNFKDDTDYKDVFGFVYQIKNIKNKKRYISYIHNNTLKEKILDLYDSALEGNVKRSKILKILSEVPYYNFKFSILKIKTVDDTTMDLKRLADNLIEKYDTFNKGYNLDTSVIKAMYKGFGKRKQKKGICIL